MEIAEWVPTVVLITGLTTLTVAERLVPAVTGRGSWMAHGWRNLALGGLNGVILALAGVPCLMMVSNWAEERGFGLLRLIPLPGGRAGLLASLAAIVAFDGLMYLWHRANHLVPWLWRFHELHHSDPEMDTTTTIRFHPIEIAISTLWRMAALPLLGMTVADLLLYETLLFPVILFHHSNIRVPPALDRLASRLIVTPRLHRIHHSFIRAESDTNFGSLLSIWDRLA